MVSKSHEPVMLFGDISVNMLHRHVTIRGEQIALSPKEFSLFYALLCKEGEAVSMDELCAAIDAAAGDTALQNQIYRLRKKMLKNGCAIVSVRGRGYVLKSVAKQEED